MLFALAGPAPAGAHEPGQPTHTGYVARVTSVEPLVLGLRAQATAGDEILVNNLTPAPVVILDRAGGPLVRIPTGESRSWHDDRVVHRGDPPPPVAGAPESDPRFVKNWMISGRTRGRAFTIEGFLGWVPPPDADDGGTSPLVLVGAGLGLLALTAAGVFILSRDRP